jgi:DtxR family Mn-dependent transcriptional regulator
MSDAVERKLVQLLDNPTISPYGNPIPGLDELANPPSERTAGVPPALEIGLQRLDELARRGGGPVEVRRIAEHVQVDADLMADLKAAGVVPGNAIEVRAIARFGDPVPVVSAEGTASVAPLIAHAVLVRAR